LPSAKEFLRFHGSQTEFDALVNREVKPPVWSCPVENCEESYFCIGDLMEHCSASHKKGCIYHCKACGKNTVTSYATFKPHVKACKDGDSCTYIKAFRTALERADISKKSETPPPGLVYHECPYKSEGCKFWATREDNIGRHVETTHNKDRKKVTKTSTGNGKMKKAPAQIGIGEKVDGNTKNSKESTRNGKTKKAPPKAPPETMTGEKSRSKRKSAVTSLGQPKVRRMPS
jgi:hypothetical protein